LQAAEAYRSAAQLAAENGQRLRHNRSVNAKLFEQRSLKKRMAELMATPQPRSPKVKVTVIHSKKIERTQSR
jgi:hypothetical protein